MKRKEWSIKVRPAKQAHNGKGYVWGIRVAGAWVETGWAERKVGARIAAERAAEALGLATDGVDMDVR